MNFKRFCHKCGYCKDQPLESSFKFRCKVAYNSGVSDAETNYFHTSRQAGKQTKIYADALKVELHKTRDNEIAKKEAVALIKSSINDLDLSVINKTLQKLNTAIQFLDGAKR